VDEQDGEVWEKHDHLLENSIEEDSEANAIGGVNDVQMTDGGDCRVAKVYTVKKLEYDPKGARFLKATKVGGGSSATKPSLVKTIVSVRRDLNNTNKNLTDKIDGSTLNPL